MAKTDKSKHNNADYTKLVDAAVKKVKAEMEDWSRNNSLGIPRVLFDEAKRSPYKPKGESKGPADRINILTPDGILADLQTRSDVVAALQPFKLFRAYMDENDSDAQAAIKSIIEGAI